MENIISKASSQQDNVLLEYHLKKNLPSIYIIHEHQKDMNVHWSETNLRKFQCFQFFLQSLIKMLQGLWNLQEMQNSQIFLILEVQQHNPSSMIFGITTSLLSCLTPILFLISNQVKMHQKGWIFHFSIQSQKPWKRYLETTLILLFSPIKT